MATDKDIWSATLGLFIIIVGGLLIISLTITYLCRRYYRLTGEAGCQGRCPDFCYQQPTQTHIALDLTTTTTTTNAAVTANQNNQTSQPMPNVSVVTVAPAPASRHFK